MGPCLAFRRAWTHELRQSFSQHLERERGDGNFVLYKWTPDWSTDTAGRDPYRILLQTDTNLVMYQADDTAVWRTGNFERQPHFRMRLTLTDAGRLEVTRNGVVIWDHIHGRHTE
ncbi:hypothetical protein WMY93_000066 [Mugilogobius chulae]|uniref:Bulb-type lectin domain-containing protein n=1 Tax=Mugilogobius chulae TaxID=88201 RepID=A0AAW0PZU5_9GOBI